MQSVHLQPHVAATAEALRAALPKLAAASAATLNSDFGKPQRHLEVKPFSNLAVLQTLPCSLPAPPLPLADRTRSSRSWLLMSLPEKGIQGLAPCASASAQALKALASSWEAAGRLQSQGGSGAWPWDASSASQLDAALAANDSQPLAPKVQEENSA